MEGRPTKAVLLVGWCCRHYFNHTFFIFCRVMCCLCSIDSPARTDKCGVCEGDGTGCEGCRNSKACNYDPNAKVSFRHVKRVFTCQHFKTVYRVLGCPQVYKRDSCVFPKPHYDCDGNCVAEVDCMGNCAGVVSMFKILHVQIFSPKGVSLIVRRGPEK